MFLRYVDLTRLGCGGGCRYIRGGGGSGEREGRGRRVRVDRWGSFSTTASGSGGDVGL